MGIFPKGIKQFREPYVDCIYFTYDLQSVLRQFHLYVLSPGDLFFFFLVPGCTLRTSAPWMDRHKEGKCSTRENREEGLAG